MNDNGTANQAKSAPKKQTSTKKRFKNEEGLESKLLSTARPIRKAQKAPIKEIDSEDDNEYNDEYDEEDDDGGTETEQENASSKATIKPNTG